MASPSELLQAIQQYTQQVRSGDAKQYQWIYFFDVVEEAQVSASLLAACGLSARCYANPDGQGARLYLQFNEATPLDERLAFVGAYFQLVRHISQTADEMLSSVPDFLYKLNIGTTDGTNVVFSLNLHPPGLGKIQYAEEGSDIAVSPPSLENSQVSLQQAAAEVVQQSAPAMVQTPTSPSLAPNADGAPPQAQPRVTPKKPVFEKKKLIDDDAGEKKSTVFGDKVGSHMASYTSQILKIGGLAFTLFVIFLMSRGFLCPDFAQSVHKKRPWYCSSGPVVPGQEQ